MQVNLLSVLVLFVFAVVIAACSGNTKAGEEPVVIKYSINENDVVPEGIAYDPGTNSFFISSTYKRKIIRVNESGRAVDFTTEGQDGLLGVVGMRVDIKRNILWAASGDVGSGMPIKNSDSTRVGFSYLHKYDITNGKLIKKYELNNSSGNHFLNDLILDSTGKPYITDTWAQKIYTVDEKGDSLRLFADFTGSYSPNGIDITADGKFLYVALYASPNPVIGRIEIAKRNLELVNLNNEFMSGADGLYYYNNSLVAIMPGEIRDTITQFFLDPTGMNVTGTYLHSTGSDMFSQPSTGVIVKDKMFFIATSNLQLFRRLYEEQKGQVKNAQLPPVRVGEIKLKTKN